MRVSIRTKSNLFLAGLLLLTVIMLSLLILSEVKKEQQSHYENELRRQTKVATLYINQSYALNSNMDNKVFLKSKGQELARQISILSGLPVVLYDMDGVKVGNSFPMDIDNSINIYHCLML